MNAPARAGLVFAAVVAADQATKALVNSSLERGEEREVLGSVVQLVNVRNTGVAFGQLQDAGLVVSLVIAVAVGALLVYFARHMSKPWIWLPTGLLLGGAIGNVIDRIVEGAVIDFVKLPSWPAFNVADSSITIGVVILVFVMERGSAARDPA